MNNMSLQAQGLATTCLCRNKREPIIAEELLCPQGDMFRTTSIRKIEI